MRLHLSDSWPLTGDYINEHGEAIYRVQTDSRAWPRTTTISKRIPPSMVSGYAEQPGGYGDAMRDRFAHLGRIDWHASGPSKLVIGGQEFESSFLKKVGMAVYGRDRIFTGPDGREYKWLLGWSEPKLILNDGSKTEVASFHTKTFSLAHKPESTYLEIMPNGEHMADMIFITFLYVEKKRRDKQTTAIVSSSSSAAAASAAAGAS